MNTSPAQNPVSLIYNGGNDRSIALPVAFKRSVCSAHAFGWQDAPAKLASVPEVDWIPSGWNFLDQPSIGSDGRLYQAGRSYEASECSLFVDNCFIYVVTQSNGQRI